MNTIKGWITTFFLATILATSCISVNAGTIIGGRNLSESCTQKSDANTGAESELNGTIIGGLTGTIIGGLVGTIIGGLSGSIIGGSDSRPVNCGTIIGG